LKDSEKKRKRGFSEKLKERRRRKKKGAK